MALSRHTFFIAGFTALAMGATGSLAQAQPGGTAPPSPGTGLVFATPQQLQGVPLASTPYSGSQLPVSVDLSGNAPQPGNQGKQNSCVGWAIAYALKTYQEKIEQRWSLLSNGRSDPARHFSAAFIYNQINNGRDAGSTFIDALNVLSNQGAATLADMPYSEADFLAQPSAASRSNASRYRIDFWRQVNVRDTNEVKAQLNAGYPVLIGATVDEGFLSLAANQVWRQHTGQRLGGHAMTLVGYDDGRRAFRVINSWGTGWGDNGYGWIDYDFSRQVINEGYIVKDATNGPAPVTPGPNPTPAPTPPSPPIAQAEFELTSVDHNVMGGPLCPCMRFTGVVRIPPGVRGEIRVVVHVNWAGTTLPVRSTSPMYALPSGAAATGTPPLALNGSALQTPWFALLPYQVLAVPRATMIPGPYGPVIGPLRTSNLVAFPGLFLNNFGVGTSQPVPFFVNM